MRLLSQFLPTADDKGQNQLMHFTVDAALKMPAATGDKVDFSPLDQSVPKVFAKAVQHQIDSLYKGIYIGLVIKLVIVLALIAAEMLFYLRYWVPRRARSSLRQPPPSLAHRIQGLGASQSRTGRNSVYRRSSALPGSGCQS
jgi:hypothetical protein